MVKFTALALVSGGLCLASSAFAGSKLAPANSMAFGKSLAQWEDIYMRWFVGNVTIPADANGNAVVNGVVLMPIPNAAGDGTPAQQAVTLNHGQAFFMPLLYELGTSYTDGTPSDPFLDRSYFTSFSVSLQIDGVPVINNSNAMDYFTQFSFAPPVPLEFANIDSLIWYQGFNVAHAPLSVGKHTIQLDEKAGQALPPNFGSLLLEYHNTWTVTVLP
ncbi:MAG TPA: hypothetical protein VFC07_10100 [Verrucomicrobiae bacterium]|nr:hypothetical protein [Verrucomicrobiae bacterium]